MNQAQMEAQAEMQNKDSFKDNLPAAFCLSLIVGVLLSPILSLLWLLVFQGGRGYYGVYGGSGVCALVYSVVLFLLAVGAKKCKDEDCSSGFPIFILFGCLFLGLACLFGFLMRRGLKSRN
jgi:asparagine N-glycosylation enzyme membrane subunit Stt3